MDPGITSGDVLALLGAQRPFVSDPTQSVFAEVYAALIASRTFNGPHFTDPNEFTQAEWNSSAPINWYTGNGTALHSNDATSLTANACMTVLNTNYSASTYKTALQVTSGMGLISHVMGPTPLAAGSNTSVRFTVDGGTPVVLTNSGGTLDAGWRYVLGTMIPDGTAGAFFTTAKLGVNEALSGYHGGTPPTQESGVIVAIPGFEQIRFFGTPCLIYRKSILIEIQTTEANSTTTASERSSLVQHLRLK